jgi:heptosyltransferase I
MAERYAEVADPCVERLGMQVLLTGGRSALDAEYGARIVGAARHPPRNLIGQTTLKQLLALIARATAVVVRIPDRSHGDDVGTPVIGTLRDDEPLARGART